MSRVSLEFLEEHPETEQFRPLPVALLVVAVLGLIFAMARSAMNRPLIGQVSARPYARPRTCPVRDYSHDPYIYRGCADPSHALDDYALGLVRLNVGRSGNHWYRIDNDAYDLSCSWDGGSCRNIAVVRNLFVPRMPRPPLYYYYVRPTD